MMNKLLIKLAKNKKSYMPFIILQCIFNSLFIIINSYLLALIIESIFIKNKNILAIKGYVTYFLLNAIIKALLNFILDILLKNLSEAIKENIKQDTFSLLINSNAYNVKQQGTGELINILTEGSDALTAYYSQYLPQFFSSVITPVIICIFVASKDLISALIMLITYPLIPIFMALIGYKSKEKNQQQWETLTSLSSHFLDMLRGLRTLKAFGRSKLQEEKVYEISENYRKSTLDVLKISFLSALVLETSATISTAIVAVNLGLRLVYNKIDFLTAFFVLVITPEFYLPLRQLGAKFHASLNGKVAIDKIEKLETSLNETLNKTDEAFIDKIPLAIEIKQLNFYYQQQEALHNLSLKIAPKETVAIIGESGSGKSTLINIIAGLLSPENAAVFINGKDINSINADDYMSKIALVPQFPHIFNMSLRENIVLGSSISEEEFLNICKLTRIDSFSHKFRNGYNTIIGDGEDTDLGGGEKQRIALARALAKNPQLIILDEPSSALDSHTEELLAELFNGVLKDKTIVLAAHRLNTVKAADKIFILEKGQLVEHGSPKELLLKKGKYYNLISLASGGDL